MKNKRFLKTCTIFLSLLVIVMIGWSFKWIYTQFGRVNFDEVAIVINSGFGGTDKTLFWSFFRKVILRSLFYAGLGTLVCHYFKYSRKSIWIVFVSYTFFLATQFAIRNVQYGSFFSLSQSNFYETEYVDPTIAKIEWGKKRNVLFIALESIEKAYSDKKIMGKVLIPNITEMEKKNKSFENYNSVSGFSHTIAAITGFTTGLPMFYTSYKNIDKMMGAYGIGKILTQNGYQTWSIFPASGKFSRKENFMQRMGFEHIIDGEKIYSELKNPPEQRPFNGVDDGVLFDYSKPIISDIIKSGQPYFIFMETINTHLNGYFTDYCRDKLGFKQETDRDIIKCDDKIISDFVQWFRRADPSAVIVLINDHAHHSHAATMPQLKKLANRALSNVFINTNIFDGADMNRPILAMDFFPTLLESAGAKIPECRLGLGTSLSKHCANVPTLREKYGDKELIKQMEKRNKLYYQLATGRK